MWDNISTTWTKLELKKSLDLTVESCVNTVGVNLNTASKHLLTYVSGLGPALAQNIVAFTVRLMGLLPRAAHHQGAAPGQGLRAM